MRLKVSFGLFLVYFCLPKINLLSIPGFAQSLRLEDVLVFFVCIGLISKNIIKIPRILIVLFLVSLPGMIYLGKPLQSVLFWLRFVEYIIVADQIARLLLDERIRMKLFSFVVFANLMFFFLSNQARLQGFYSGPWELASVLLVLSLTLNSRSKFYMLVVTVLAKARIQLGAFFIYVFFQFRLLGLILVLFAVLFFPLYSPLLRFDELLVMDYKDALIRVWNGSKSDFHILLSQGDDASLLERLLIWREYIRPIERNWFFILSGIGFGSGGVVVDGTYIRLIIDFGIVGSLIIFRYLWGMRTKSQSKLNSLILVTMIIGITNDIIVSSRIFIAVVVAFHILKRERKCQISSSPAVPDLLALT